jgi:hypothetical protein
MAVRRYIRGVSTSVPGTFFVMICVTCRLMLPGIRNTSKANESVKAYKKQGRSLRILRGNFSDLGSRLTARVPDLDAIICVRSCLV